VSERDTSEGFNPNVDPQQPNLGAMLRTARELRELTIEDLARRLRLEPRIIRHLENDQIEQLPAPAFTRGYVRSIAKELNIEIGPLLAILDLRFESEPPALADFKTRAPIQITSDSSIIRYTTLALVIVTVVMVALWWRSNDNAMLEGADTLVGEQSDSPHALGMPLLEDEEQALEYPIEEDFYSAEPQLEQDIDATEASLANDIPIALAPTIAANEDSGDVEPDVIEIVTLQEAWIDVRDALGTRLYFDFGHPGQDIRLSGTAPYALTIGNAEQVSVQFNGQVVALDEFSNEGVARFNLGAATSPP
jgi:cytoskeleton protein RodZ